MKTKEKTVVIPPVSTRFSDGISFLTGDWGNRRLKQMLTGVRPSVTEMENSVVVLTEGDWEKKKARFKYAPGHFYRTQAFGYRGRDANNKKTDRMIYCIVGDSAKHHGKVKTMTEEIKYDYNLYWGAIVCSQLLEMFPDGNDQIVLALAHPTKSIGQRDMMINATLGKHYVEKVDGTKVTFTVREVLPWDEPVGGIIRWTESLEAQYNKHELKRGQVILVTDIGGGVSSFTRVVVDYDSEKRIQLRPVYDQTQSPSIGMGIRTIMDKLRITLLEDHPAFAGMKDNITDDMLEDGLRTGMINLSGNDVDVTKQREFAEYEFLDQIELRYKNDLGGGRPFPLIVNTGGGMHTYHLRLINEIYNHPYVELAGDMSIIHLANLQGGDEIFRQWIARERMLR